MCIPKSAKPNQSQGFTRDTKQPARSIKVTRKSYLRGDKDFIDERKKIPKKEPKKNSWVDSLFS